MLGQLLDDLPWTSKFRAAGLDCRVARLFLGLGSVGLGEELVRRVTAPVEGDNGLQGLNPNNGMYRFEGASMSRTCTRQVLGSFCKDPCLRPSASPPKKRPGVVIQAFVLKKLSVESATHDNCQRSKTQAPMHRELTGEFLRTSRTREIYGTVAMSTDYKRILSVPLN